MTAPGTKICRHCVYAVFERSPSGAAKRRTAGKCEAAGSLVSAVIKAANKVNDNAPPCIVVSVDESPIYPTSNAKLCPLYERKGAGK